MKDKIYRHKGLLALIVGTVIIGCATVPILNRKQLLLIPKSEMLSMSFSEYRKFLSSHRVISGTPQAQMVARVAHRLQVAVTNYLRSHHMGSRISGYRWEYHLVADPQVNAWCMPGGKIVVYTGILKYTQTEAGLAVVLGHEISHAVARHGDERMSQLLLVQLGGLALSVALHKYPEKTRKFWLAALGIGAQLGFLLPYSRLHETEADHLGLLFMSMAGYDPHEAIRFWGRMAQHSRGSIQLEFLRTHPTDAHRVANMKRWLPEALRFYKRAKNDLNRKVAQK